MRNLAAMSGSSEPSLPAVARRRVLVAEDNRVNQMVIVRMLGALGYEADVAWDGEEAARAVLAGGYAAVLMDIQMPVCDGVEAARRIRAAEDGPRRLPIIAVTAGIEEEERPRCEACGIDDLLTKPLTVERLGDALARWVGGGQDRDIRCGPVCGAP